MRGTKTFNDTFKGREGSTGKPKGRNNEVLDKRNDCLIHRYYYYGNFTDKRFDAILEQLHEEFFLSIRTIADIIRDNVEQLQYLKKKAPEAHYFQSRWPHLKW